MPFFSNPPQAAKGDRDRFQWTALTWPLAVYLLLHAGLVLHNLAVPDAIMRGDRAGQRVDHIESFLAAPDEVGRLVLATGWPGDWLAHGLAWWAGGPLLVVLVQIGLSATAVAATVGIAQALGAGTAASATAGMLAAALPGGIMNPHLLVTESWYTAGFALALWAFAEAVRRDRPGLVVGGMVLMAAAALIRPQGMILAPIAFGILCLVAPHLRRSALIGVIIAVAIAPGLWVGWRNTQTGELGLGPSSFDLPLNLCVRAKRAIQMGDLDRTELGRCDRRMGLGDFLNFTWQHPIPIARTYVTDSSNMLLNPGANHLFGHYLKIIQTPGWAQVRYWQRLVDEKGPGSLLGAVMAQGAGLITVLLLMGAIHATALLGAALGAWHVKAYGARSAQRAGVLMLVLALAQIATTFATGAVRWAHRAPLEPLIAASAGLGLHWAYTKLRQRRGGRFPLLLRR